MSLDVKQLVRMSPEERERLMSQVFSQLLTMSREQVVSTLVEFLKQLSAATDDDQYKEVCKSSAFIVTSGHPS
jgi:hypothetical protein